MNCSSTISIALLLLSLTGGTFLLYKTQKENLSTLFKAIAWFVIIMSFGSMICCSVRCVFHGCRKAYECKEMKQCEMGMNNCEDDGEGMGMMHGRMKRRMMMMPLGEEGCEMRERGCCKESRGECEEKNEEVEKMGCCKKGVQKCEMKKDSVVVIKKK